jgi:hypothetical protein
MRPVETVTCPAHNDRNAPPTRRAIESKRQTEFETFPALVDTPKMDIAKLSIPLLFLIIMKSCD